MKLCHALLFLAVCSLAVANPGRSFGDFSESSPSERSAARGSGPAFQRGSDNRALNGQNQRQVDRYQLQSNTRVDNRPVASPRQGNRDFGDPIQSRTAVRTRGPVSTNSRSNVNGRQQLGVGNQGANLGTHLGVDPTRRNPNQDRTYTRSSTRAELGSNNNRNGFQTSRNTRVNPGVSQNRGSPNSGLGGDVAFPQRGAAAGRRTSVNTQTRINPADRRQNFGSRNSRLGGDVDFPQGPNSRTRVQGAGQRQQISTRGGNANLDGDVDWPTDRNGNRVQTRGQVERRGFTQGSTRTNTFFGTNN